MSQLSQNYEHYTQEDREVWRTLYDRQQERLKTLACSEYMEAQRSVRFRADEIPHVDELNALLGDATGWKLQVVPCIQPNDVFFPCLARREFTATTWLRSKAQLDYISEPDMFHDVYGHVPLLSHPVFADFFHRFGELGVRYLHDNEAIEMLGRVYWFTVEFGLIRENNETKIFGAGLISSHGESHHCLTKAVEHRPFNIREIMRTEFDNSVMQNLYFVLPSFHVLLDSLADIESNLIER